MLEVFRQAYSFGGFTMYRIDLDVSIDTVTGRRRWYATVWRGHRLAWAGIARDTAAYARECAESWIATQDNTSRRLAEVRQNAREFPHNDRARALAKVLARKSIKLNATEQKVLANWRDVNLAASLGPGAYLCSRALVYAPALCGKPRRDHAAIVKLLDLGYLEIHQFNDPENGLPCERIQKITPTTEPPK